MLHSENEKSMMDLKMIFFMLPPKFNSLLSIPELCFISNCNYYHQNRGMWEGIVTEVSITCQENVKSDFYYFTNLQSALGRVYPELASLAEAYLRCAKEG